MQLLKRFASLSLADVFWGSLRQSRWVAVLLLGIVAWADLSSAETRTLGALWCSAKSDWAWATATVIATVLVAWDPGGRRTARRRTVHLLDERSNYALVALSNLRAKIKPRKNSFDAIDDAQNVFEPLLIAAQRELEIELGMGSSAGVKTNLLLLTGEGRVTVVARSQPGSPVPVSYDLWTDSPAARAMRENKTIVLGSIDEVKEGANRPYKAVAATPLEFKGKVYGALTVDSPMRGVFRRHEVSIDRVLRVHAAVCLLMLPGELNSLDCPNRYGR